VTIIMPRGTLHRLRWVRWDDDDVRWRHTTATNDGRRHASTITECVHVVVVVVVVACFCVRSRIHAVRSRARARTERIHPSIHATNGSVRSRHIHRRR
jgi:hypothetical protein